MAKTQYDLNSKILREWAPLTDLFSKLPTKYYNGIFYQEVKLTCVDILPEFVALGTNVGVVYWFDRKNKDMQRLRCENPNVPITSVKIISTVDYMVACGNNYGSISIFQIPKSHPESLPENLKPKNKQVERYTVTELHKAPVSAIEWSKNGMKLFSGDKNGCVVVTEIDFYMHICKSEEILNEAYEVVQLSYNMQRLLVSTTYRSIICQKLDKWIVCQVGKKDRKVLGNFGGIVFQNGYKTSDTRLYCTRPGLRIWIADIEGNVGKTLLFKELLSRECREVPVINPISRSLRSLKPQMEPSFGILLPFSQNLLVTYSNDIVYILDPQEMTILYTISHLRGVLNLGVYKDEIFILEEDRSLIRIGYEPELVYDGNMSLNLTNTFLPITSSIKQLTTKLQTTSIISAIPPILENISSNTVDIHTDENLIMNAEEAKESPIKLRNIDRHIGKKFDDIGKQEFSDKILFKKSKTRKKKSSMETSALSLSSNSSEDKDLNYTHPMVMNLSSVGVLPDLRSPESIKYDIEYKEKILADVLNLDKVKITPNKNEVEKKRSSDEKYFKDIRDTHQRIPEVGNVKITDGQSSPAYDIRQDKLTPNKNGVEKKRDSDEKYFKDIRDTHQRIPEVSNFKITDGEPSPAYDIKKVTNVTPPYTPPACITIPNEWKLSSIHLRERKESVLSDNSLSDWEIV